MGTRNLTMVISNGETKVAQYGQWDGYPSGQGLTVLNFLKNTDLNKFKEKLKNCVFITDSKIKSYYKKVGADNSGWVNMKVAAKFKKEYPQLDRDMAAEVLQFIMDTQNKKIELSDNSNFIKDGLFCEWAYIINLDTNTLEVKNGADKKFSLSKLPTAKQFLKALGEN